MILPKAYWPTFLCGDCGFGNEAMMAACQQRQIDYSFKLRLTTKVKAPIHLVSGTQAWSPAGGDWQGVDRSLQLMGWSCWRRVIVLRRRRQPPQPSLPGIAPPHAPLPFEQTLPQAEVYDYAVLVTSLGDEITTIAQPYRDRTDAENGFDELKNQWGWQLSVPGHNGIGFGSGSHSIETLTAQPMTDLCQRDPFSIGKEQSALDLGFWNLVFSDEIFIA